MKKIILISFFIYETLSAEVKKPISTDIDAILKLKRTYQNRIDVSTEIPRYPEYYSWKIKGDVYGEKVFESNVPIYRYDEIMKEMIPVGSVQIGTEVELNISMVYHSRNFYHYLLPNEGKDSIKDGWIDGIFISRDNEKSWSPPPKRKIAK
ncbi:MAG: hypothetical protein HQK54_04655 [Oligoflexales bacterium]|nr:hypothetical protein [Oligoflexales bacterium]